MGKILKCPDCEALVAEVFPLHICRPKEKEKKKMSNRYWHTKSTRIDKLTWLLNHQHLWEGWEDLGDPRKREIFDQMVKDGLVSEKTYWRDLNLTRLINDARKLRRDIKFKIAQADMGLVPDTSPVPSAHKSLSDYQNQLKAKRKRRKR